MKVQTRRQLVAVNVYYTPPGDKETLIYDFYAAELLDFSIKKGPVQGFSTDQGDSTLASAREAIPSVLNAIIPLILNSIYQAVAGEMRHLRGFAKMPDDSPSKPIINKYFREYTSRSHSVNLTGFKDPKERAQQYASDGKIIEPSVNLERNIGITAAMKSGSPTTFMRAAEDVFRNGGWSPSYGGKKWADICVGWLELSKARTVEDKFSWVDHCLDLEHNNNTVFDKIPSFAKNGNGKYTWIKRALDFKYEAPPIQLLGKCSSQMKKICLRLFRDYNPALLNDPTKKSIEQTVDPIKVGDWVVIDNPNDPTLPTGQGEVLKIVGSETPGLVAKLKFENQIEYLIPVKFLRKIDKPDGSSNSPPLKIGDTVKVNRPGAEPDKQSQKIEIGDIVQINASHSDFAHVNGQVGKVVGRSNDNFSLTPSWFTIQFQYKASTAQINIPPDQLLLVAKKSSLPENQRKEEKIAEVARKINKALIDWGIHVNPTSIPHANEVVGTFDTIKSVFQDFGGLISVNDNKAVFTVPRLLDSCSWTYWAYSNPDSKHQMLAYLNPNPKSLNELGAPTLEETGARVKIGDRVQIVNDPNLSGLKGKVVGFGGPPEVFPNKDFIKVLLDGDMNVNSAIPLKKKFLVLLASER